ncbi:cytochrome b560 subunit of succinate dehydrogenase [Rhizophagus irregularis]|uniref:Cytochrome b560 subunit of succinate dehydrogenase n=5 Tax=Rhizophagus irregularis TaxID=588596 RepID=A0A2I1EVC0_9GLOM|nr:succinate dehydrogenase cytochrome b subunit SDH3 [Rhizophagus irregularis DAOM 197198w]PKC14192.1 cytochrome b560 subunit of succinate dehydrogenase [Rhizophagus irregularis]GBC48968.1 succinate dehydrogenase cytochrome b560 subunit [Rhizophagus irregularis DAOM 181602=DAOM 197198]PKC74485.1 cytochrome b560 subunit of succinate dehydrogenase [Rhizophagus irregularis]PKK73022.1 cytochrome b560 subunit of succinate dehydrogenase [Rhizophagus irregularis]
MYSTSLVRSFRAAGSSSLLRTSMTRNGVFSILKRNTRQDTTSATSQGTSQEEILVSQRAKRPLSPFMIYQPQLTWYMSFAHRATGAGLAAGLYGTIAAYAFGGPDSDTLVAAVSTLPPTLKLAGKFCISYAFTYHTFNGIRHLIWDTGKALTIKGVYGTGYAVLILSTLSSIVLSVI